MAGVVRDGAGQTVPGARLTLQSPDTGVARRAESGGSGEYECGGLIPSPVIAVNVLGRLPYDVDLVPVLFVSSGQPLNVTTGKDDNGDTIFNDRPPGVARNSSRTAGFAQVDLGLARRFALGAASLEVRAEVFNVFNGTNFSGFFNWGASGVRLDEQGVLAFQPAQAGLARQFQFVGRVRF